MASNSGLVFLPYVEVNIFTCWIYLFVCLFVRLFVCLFLVLHLSFLFLVFVFSNGASRKE